MFLLERELLTGKNMDPILHSQGLLYALVSPKCLEPVLEVKISFWNTGKNAVPLLWPPPPKSPHEDDYYDLEGIE